MLDAVLEDGRLAIEAVTGASAGAMNAVVMVEGWVNGGIDGARSQLETFWRKASVGSALSSLQRGLLRQLLGYWRNQPWMTAVTQNLGPYQVNPLNINPLRAAIDALIDFDLVRASTDVKIFINQRLDRQGHDLPEFRAHGRSPDGLRPHPHRLPGRRDRRRAVLGRRRYTGNPALLPLYYETRTDDILLVQINPLERRQTPRTVREIENRLNEITFTPCCANLRAVAFVQRLIEDGRLSAKGYEDVHLHRIDGAGALDKYQASSRLITEWDFFKKLRDAGRQTSLACGKLRRDRGPRDRRSGKCSEMTQREQSDPEIGRSIQLGDVTVNVHEVGAGPPVLLIHESGPEVTAFANWRLACRGCPGSTA